MTNVGDVMRQIETMLGDPLFPPTPDQKEALDRILYAVYSGTVEFKGRKYYEWNKKCQ
ncbi:MAG: hypothetical protein ABSG49_09030 [Methanoregula sp.]|jgi:hypothetical protein|uniref:hypothetical protein n=1 Tax=Methanoregula sp. TaxID=2052170 RepID=UPI003C1C4AB0